MCCNGIPAFLIAYIIAAGIISYWQAHIVSALRAMMHTHFVRGGIKSINIKPYSQIHTVSALRAMMLTHLVRSSI